MKIKAIVTVLKSVILLVRWCNLEHIKLSHHIDVSR